MVCASCGYSHTGQCRIAALKSDLEALRQNYTGAVQDVEHLEAEVARLTEERDIVALQAAELAQTTGDVVDQQRGDIRRLMEALMNAGLYLPWMQAIAAKYPKGDE